MEDDNNTYTEEEKAGEYSMKDAYWTRLFCCCDFSSRLWTDTDWVSCWVSGAWSALSADSRELKSSW